MPVAPPPVAPPSKAPAYTQVESSSIIVPQDRPTRKCCPDNPSTGAVIKPKTDQETIGRNPTNQPLTASGSTAEGHGSSALESILEAQEGNLRDHPPYEQALAEIRGGAKRSCWMWYIWPSMQGFRIHGRPEMLLPSLEEAIEYLEHETLGERLVEITEAADEVLRLTAPKCTSLAHYLPWRRPLPDSQWMNCSAGLCKTILGASTQKS
jgi:Protein of unknown function (DUF1810)